MRGDEGRGADAMFRRMFERSADAILLIDAASNRFVEYNQATLDMLRCTRDELSALHPSELSPPTQPDERGSFEKANEMIATAIERGSHRFEWVHRSPRRDDFFVEVLLTPLEHEGRSLVVVVWRDITERKASERALQQAQKLESLGVLAGGIAHDFNNLLTAALGHLQLARGQASEGVRQRIESAELALRRAADLTRQLLAYSGKGRAVVEPVQLEVVVREMLELLRVSMSKGVRLELLADEVPAIDADRAQLQQVVMNLVTNAGEAIGDTQGQITIRITEQTGDDEPLSRELSGQQVRAGRLVRLEVSDTGVGIEPEVQARIFDPFFSTKQPGRGLGLAALRGILRAHGAGISVKSAPGRGTTFTVVWPVSTLSARVAVAARAAPDAKARGTVLLVDDEADVRASVGGLLSYVGLEVVEASDGDEAVERYRTAPGRYAFVLMDVTMRRLDGCAALVEMRRLDPSAVVVLMSGWAEGDLATRLGDCRPSGFLAKPFVLDDVIAMLQRLGMLGGEAGAG